MNTYRNIKRFVICLVILAGTCNFMGCRAVANPATGKNDLILLTNSDERAIGERTAPDFENEFGGRHPDIHLQSYLHQLGSDLAKESDRDIPHQFVLLNSPNPNSLSLPGGKIYITVGMMRAVENEMQLSALLAHEIGHTAARHNVKVLQSKMGASLTNISSKLADMNRSAQTVAELVTNLTYLRYSSKEESEADLLAANYMLAAGLDPWGLVELLKVQSRLSPSGTQGAVTLSRTHPQSSDRIAQAEKHIQEIFGNPVANRSSDRNTKFQSMKKLLQ